LKEDPLETPEVEEVSKIEIVPMCNLSESSDRDLEVSEGMSSVMSDNEIP
jgi:hypothetical protein